MILDSIKLLLPELKDFIKYRRDKKNEVYMAVEAIQRAANRTRFVIASNNYQPHTPNSDLSNLWVDAAAAVRELDRNLYERLLEKSDYWADPRNWDNQMVADARIYIDDIIEDSNRILQELSERNR